MSAEPFDTDRVSAIDARLELREPNRCALETLAAYVTKHFEIEQRPPPFRAVLDSATGVGKTYVLAAALEYFAAEGTRNFAVITPGRTILEKTQGNFTPGHPKSLLGGMEVKPVVITSENFSSPAMRAAMDDPDEVKLYVFTVQSLTTPSTKQGKKTHEFNEGLGAAFYAALQGTDDLMVFADEHHSYFGKSFADAVNDLDPRALVGLTATPHKNTPNEEIIYQYPLSAAIADELVKTPVLVGRKDDRTDLKTKLLDGAQLLRLKERAVETYCAAEEDAGAINPLMLVIAQSIEEAEELETILKDPTFAKGEFAEKVLRVDSKAGDEALAQLEKLEEPGSPFRIVISVGMLKEGWDNKAVFVIASLRASVSTTLTEQTLGRGLRLPFGHYTGIQALDTLEVLAHENYEKLLKKKEVLQAEFIDWRTSLVFTKNAAGEAVPSTEKSQTEPELGVSEDGNVQGAGGKPMIASFEDYSKESEGQLDKLQEELMPRADCPKLSIPRVKMDSLKAEFSLADITDTDRFEKAGKSIASNPDAELRRTTISARIVEGADGLRHTELVTAPAAEPVKSGASLIPLEDSWQALLDGLLGAGVVPARKSERQAAAPIMEAFVQGLGEDAEELLSAYGDRAAAKLVELVTEAQREYKPKVAFKNVVELIDFDKTRLSRPKTTQNLAGKFARGVGYEYSKSAFTQDWFDSGPERDVANVLDGAEDVDFWLRLQVGDLPILWAEDRSYNADFVVIEKDDTHLIVEVKMQKEMTSEEVLGKRKAAKRWVNHVNKDSKVKQTWGYLLLGEDDIKAAKGSWPALKKLAS